jgi:RND family efflux transporter MFP subunit
MSELSARFSLKNSQYQLEYAQEELRQLQKMYEADDLTEETEELILKRSRRDVEYAEFALKRSEEMTERLLNYTLPKQLERLQRAAEKQELDYSKTEASMPRQLEQQRLQHKKLVVDQQDSEDKLAQLKRDREALGVRSPLDGIVYYGSFDGGSWNNAAALEARLLPGGTIGPNEVFMTVVEPDSLQASGAIAEKDLALVRKGTPATLTPTAFPQQTIQARVSSIERVPTKPGSFDCTISFTSDNIQRLLPGMSCKMKLKIYDKPKALTVPATAVFEDDDVDGESVVYVQSGDEKPEKRTVEVGQRTEKKVEILKGLKAGETILAKKPEK